MTVELLIEGPIARVCFNRPEAMNAYNDAMANDLLEISETLLRTPDIRAVLLCGNGPAFMAGGDIRHFHANLKEMPRGILQSVRQLNASILNLSHLDVPILAKTHGSAAGVGISLLCAADLVISSDDCKFTLAYGNLGLSSDGGASYWLPRTVGRRKAMEMFLLPEVFNAENAKTHGLVNWVVPKEQLTEESERILQRLANGPSAAYKEVKCLVRSTWDNSLAEQLEEEAHSFARCTCTEDFGRGVTAFLAKQRPEFVGC